MRFNFKETYRNILPYKVRYNLSVYVNEFLTYKRIKNWNVQDTPFPRYLEIETLNRCNGKCAFCPVNATQPQREYKKMEETTFKKIIAELEEESWDGHISLFSNNEPFLDERIPEWLKYTDAHLPKAKVIVFTNGSVLTMDKFIECIKYTDQFVIDNYSLNNDVNNNLIEIKEYIDSHSEIKGVYFMMRKQDEVLSSRGGGGWHQIRVA